MDKKLKIVLSFDDGRKDFYDVAFPILKKYGLTATLNITTGYVDGSWTVDWATSYGAVNKDEVRKMSDYGIEIAYHGDRHITDTKDFLTSIEKFKNWGLDYKNTGFAVPGSYLEKVDVPKFVEFLKDNDVNYMRVDNDPRCTRFISKVFRKMYNMTHGQIFYNIYNNLSVAKKGINPYRLSSVIVFKNDEESTLINFIKRYLGSNYSIIFMLHGILDEQSPNYGLDEYAWSAKRFDNFCRALKEMCDDGNLEVITTIDLVKKEKTK